MPPGGVRAPVGELIRTGHSEGISHTSAPFLMPTVARQDLRMCLNSILKVKADKSLVYIGEKRWMEEPRRIDSDSMSCGLY